MQGMTYEEKLLTRCLLLSGMHWTKAAYIVGKLPAKGIVEMLEYIAINQELDPETLYSTALKTLEKTKDEGKL